MSDKIIVISTSELAQLIKESITSELDKITALYKTTVVPILKSSEYCLISEAAEITGLAKSTIRTKCHLGEMPYYKPAGTKMLKFKRTELEAWVADGRVKTIQEIDQANSEYLISKKSRK
jgi:excisionase family DNA binding protein